MAEPDSQPHDPTVAHFDAHSDYWHDIYFDPDSYNGYALRKQLDFVLSAVQAGERVLDVGCGAGVLVAALAKRGHEVAGVDSAPRMIERAQQAVKEQHVSPDLRVASAEKLPYPDNHFDTVVALGLLANLADERPALHEMRRVLGPGGRLLLTMPNVIALDVLSALPRSFPIMLEGTRLRRPMRVLANAGRRLTGCEIKPLAAMRPGNSVLSPRYARRLRANGFDDVQVHALTFGPLMPLGFGWLGAQKQIAISEKLASWAGHSRFLRAFGSLMLYDARAVR